MVADYPEAYAGQPGIELLFRIPATWDETRVLHAEMGRCLVIARRRGQTWYVGGMTAPEGRTLDLPLDFLGAGSFNCQLWLDKPDEGPTALAVREETLPGNGQLRVVLPPSGGFAARIAPVRP
jgi:alpha-glucosidase